MAQSLAVDYGYRYPFASRLIPSSGHSRLRLATSGGLCANPYFFTGRLAAPKLTAALLLILNEVSRTRYFSWQAYAAARAAPSILNVADPVVTSGGERLRFEAFSVCGSVYARLDMLPESVDGDWVGRGTTNVDFNEPMRNMLGAVGELEDVKLNVGADQLEIERCGEKVIEKKVSLPDQWLKGFVEVQSYQQRMKPFLEITGAQAHAFLKSLPEHAASRKGDIGYLAPMGKGIHISRVQTHNGVPIGAAGRLKAAERLADSAHRVRIFSESGGACAWQFDFPNQRFTLIITADASRGFSGEGQILTRLAEMKSTELVPKIRAALQWQARVDATEIARQISSDIVTVENILSLLGTRGLVGFDLEDGAYFQRELPFCAEHVEQTQPRLKSAKRLAKSGGVRIMRREGKLVEAYAPGENGEHFVYFNGAKEKCTCPWFVRYGGERGPCRHVLAVRMKLDELDGD